jgi:hypothetical protein
MMVINKEDEMARKTSKKVTEEMAYTITIQPLAARKKSLKKSVDARGSMRLCELDQIIRDVMDYDTSDHLSGFYMGKPGRSPEIATVDPEGGGENSAVTIEELGLSAGSQLGYIYDFGDNIQSMLTVERVMPFDIRF